MKKILIVFINCIFILNFITGCSNKNSLNEIENNKELIYEDIVNEIVRFHVIANSDTEEDQNLKLKVRDKVIEFISPKLINCTSLDESRKIIIENEEEMKKIASKVIEENGYTYQVQTMLSKENFPDKSYGDLIFPQGEYEAFRILIGNASGQNWWCVMFPPLCFVDGTKDAINSEETEKKIEDSLTKKNNKDNKKVKFKFKLFEILFNT